MKTKTIIAAFAASAAVFTGCLKNETVPMEHPATSKLTVNVSCDIDSKAAGINAEDNEKKINSVQVFVFSSDNKLEAEAYGTAPTLEMVTTKGEKTVKVLVNHERLTTVTMLSDWTNYVAELEVNKTNSFLMTGEESITVNDNTVNLSTVVTRQVTKVVLKKITNNMALTQYQGSPVKVVGIYLINVVGHSPLQDWKAPTRWLNKGGRDSEENSIYAEFPASKTISFGSADSSEHYFYCLQNPTSSDSQADTWCARHTRLVLEAQIDGKTCYYPITLPPLKPNHIYTINELTLTRPGTDSPDMTAPLSSMSFNLQVQPWSNETVSDVTI